MYKSILNDENYTPVVVSLLVHKMRGEERGAYFKFRPIAGALIRRGRLFGGGGGVANSRIYGTFNYDARLLTLLHRLLLYVT